MTHEFDVEQPLDDDEHNDLSNDPLEMHNLWLDRGPLAFNAESLTILTHRMAFRVDPCLTDCQSCRH